MQTVLHFTNLKFPCDIANVVYTFTNCITVCEQYAPLLHKLH